LQFTICYTTFPTYDYTYISDASAPSDNEGVGESCAGCGSESCITDCELQCINESTANNWTGDSTCDDGAWNYYLNCEFFDYDGGDCSYNFPGTGNISTDPLFTDSINNDYTLQPYSPCIDAGTADLNGDGIDDIIDYVGLAPDMGAYESYPTGQLGDASQDDEINISDIIIIAGHQL
jgi:hypothetical protein